MHTLLKRQLKKYLSGNLGEDDTLSSFLTAVERSYENYDDKLSMLQRATTISSEELYAANRELENEAQRQKHILNSLEKAITSLEANLEHKNHLDYNSEKQFDAEKLAKHISDLASKVATMASEKDHLLKDLKTQNESLNNYAHIVSHDLKSPIRNISTLMNWILEDEKEKFSTDSRSNCSLITQNLEKMDKLIDGILEHATMGTTSENYVSFSLKSVLDNLKQTLYIPKNINIIYADTLPILFCEIKRIEQLFMNLIINAVTATEAIDQGIIEIKAKDQGDHWKFSITDNGKGIPENHQSSIFEMFKKLDTDSKSTGIGLALVKKIVDLYEGEISLKSEENKGTTFFFTLKKPYDRST
tara:strand:- start:19239 stop:20315 length:1077 start_codon:yes stop_codon:yes gene_type:complete